MVKKSILTDCIPVPKTAYSQAVLAEGGTVLFISGQVPVDPEGNLVGAGDFRAQAHQVFRNLEAVLGAAGADWTNVTRLGVYLTDMRNFPAFNEVRQEYLAPDFPAATAIGDITFVNPEWMVEVEAIAVLD